MLYRDGNNDYWDFYNSFDGEGFSLLINMAQGGVMPGAQKHFGTLNAILYYSYSINTFVSRYLNILIYFFSRNS